MLLDFTESLRRNNDFRRAYSRGRSAAEKCLVVYAKRNGSRGNRLGLTVSAKIGCAVVRNRIRRRLRKIYRLHEGDFRRGYDIVVVARHRAAQAEYARLERELLRAAAELKLLAEEAEA